MKKIMHRMSKHINAGLAVIVMFLILTVLFVFWVQDTLKAYYFYTSSPLTIQTRNNIINQTLDDLLAKIPDAIAVRVNLIHKVNFAKDDQTPLLRWDTVYARAAPTYAKGPGPLLRDQSLIAWSDYVENLSAGKCTYLMTKNLSREATHQHLIDIGIYAFDVCPIVNSKNNLLGAIFLSWQENNLNTNPESLFPIIKKVADKIAVTLEESPL
ncbi:MAG TPA: hypothetical protein VNX68_02075 [Nitrosopumilaceae archaeon]|nr:hypothetical protein [Nitrosopumilaceae archaeon]